MDEKTFFEYEGVKVTNTRFVVDGQTFAMRNITSVNSLTEPPQRFWGIICLLIGIAATTENAFFGIPVIALSIYFLYKQRAVYHVMLRTSGGETKALTTYQKEYLGKVVAALNDAIVHRG
ncbi:QacE-like protein [Hydrogenophaga taeniospiralis CCUG 15921]|uniref:QacE-like protein n=1 Tax=Hydrogenophaga taeniospiralis CCUG 15921 TaxID=1281780 RepID=A0A9X4SFB0_9BURK|nr:DUF6232 family protein [Hydrogenophaga taeniospiralis]MDG5975856.1 QacE-like protein [Hydrogenophaga taeniospiralis CCUG 15921]